LAEKDVLCSELSLATKEEMFGTAPRVDIWLLLEYKQAWSKRAFPSSKIPQVIKKRLSEYMDSIPNCRLQLIKRQNAYEDTIKFYVGVSRELEPRLFEFNLSRYEDLLSFDITEIVGGKLISREEPLFLVCTHGTNDRCCSKFGVPVYLEAARQEEGFLTWQCTHLGGHRFAANFLCLPHGIYYGRVRESSLANLISEYKKENICLETYRGRSCYDSYTQAAEYFLRVNTGIRKIATLKLKGINRLGTNNWIIEFASELDSKIHVMHIERRPSAIEGHTSCRDGEKSLIPQYKLIEHRTL
jgi:hypothetical protein